jgi:putative heme-binding domain-containing protein
MRCWIGLVCVGILTAQTPKAKLDDPAVIARGQKIFSGTCGIYFCHGSGGLGGRAPHLAGRKWDTDAVFKIVKEGSANRLMPSFKDQMNDDQIWSAIAYVLTLGSGAAASQPTASTPSEEPSVPAKPTDPNAGDPEAGRSIFFDASNAQHCSICHQHGGRGTSVGPDLTAVAKRPAAEILQDILDPDARLGAQPVTVVTKSGERVMGMARQETRELIRIYDLRALPPVLRTIYKDQIVSTTLEKKSPMPGDYGQTFSRKQLLDLVAFLKGIPVSPAELAPPP